MADLENNIGNEQTIKKYKADKECVYNCVSFLRCTISVFFPCRRYLLEKTKGGKDIQNPFLCHVILFQYNRGIIYSYKKPAVVRRLTWTWLGVITNDGRVN